MGPFRPAPGVLVIARFGGDDGGALRCEADVVEALPGEDPAILTPYCGPDGEFNAPTPCPPPVDGDG